MERAVPDAFGQARPRHSCPFGPRPLHVENGGLRPGWIPEVVPLGCRQWAMRPHGLILLAGDADAREEPAEEEGR
eukprot:7311313-Alexandrium_andersonii.AAC.1